MAHPLRPRRPEREQAPASASQSTHLRRGHGRYRSLSIMKARDRGLRVCLGALLTLRGLGQKGHSERVGDGWRARGGVRASRGSMESYNIDPRCKESAMDSWERFTSASRPEEEFRNSQWCGECLCLYRFERIHPPWECSAELQGRGGHGAPSNDLAYFFCIPVGGRRSLAGAVLRFL